MSTEFKPGWLMIICHDAHMRCMMDHDPAALRHLVKLNTPIPEGEMRELYDRMNERFKKWTGQDLAVFPRS